MLIINIGTGNQGGIDSVIHGYETDGLYDHVKYKRVVSQLGNNKFQDIYLFIKALIICFALSLSNRKVIYHCHLSYNGSFWRKLIFLLLSKAVFAKIIMHLHGSEFKKYVDNSSTFKRHLIVFLIIYSSEFVVLSNSWADYIYELSGRQPLVINNYVDVPQERDLQQKDRSGIVFLAAFVQRKGIYELIHAYSKIKTKQLLHLCGAGENDKVHDLVQKLGIQDKVIFHGWVNTDQKYDLLNTCSVFVLPSFNEGLPMSIIEAMGSNITVVTTPVGAIPEYIINEQTGILVKQGNVESIKEGLLKVLEDSDLRLKLTKQSFLIYEKNFSLNKVLPKWLELYDKFLKA
jgi:glycosyltransferase involved in cell wall biosynthesis